MCFAISKNEKYPLISTTPIIKISLKVGQPIDIQVTLRQATALQKKGHLLQAQSLYQKILKQDPNNVSVLHLSSGISHQLGQNNAAATLLEKAIDNCPNEPVLHSNLAMIYHVLKRCDEAILAAQQALALDPDCDMAHTNLGIALSTQGRISEAAKHFRQVIHLKPHDAAAYSNLGEALQYRGKVDEAIKCFKKSQQLNQKYNTGLLMCLNYSTSVTQDEIFYEHMRWGNIRSHQTISQLKHINAPDPKKRLRIGYVSPDFYFHSVAFFIEPVIAHHHKDNVEVFCYAEVPNPDKVTEQIWSYADHWRNTCGKSDTEIAEQIRSDKIDILVDLAGHTGNKRLLVFAHKPAPIQVTWLGYPNTTGLPEIDYFITDAYTDPPGQNEKYYTETLLRLPHTFACYSPPIDNLEITSLPALKTGHIVFGSFNNIMKLNQDVIALWARVLKAIPLSTLLLQTRSLADQEISQEIQQLFASHGVLKDRLIMHGNMHFRQYMEQYNQVDIILDSFPWHGHTNTCHAAWMGVPTIVLAGDRHASRMGISVMENLGLPNLVAQNENDYVDITTRITSNLEQLQEMRKTLRHRLLNSPICDSEGFTCDLETAYRSIWNKWCTQQ